MNLNVQTVQILAVQTSSILQVTETLSCQEARAWERVELQPCGRETVRPAPKERRPKIIRAADACSPPVTRLGFFPLSAGIHFDNYFRGRRERRLDLAVAPETTRENDAQCGIMKDSWNKTSGNLSTGRCDPKFVGHFSNQGWKSLNFLSKTPQISLIFTLKLFLYWNKEKFNTDTVLILTVFGV